MASSIQVCSAVYSAECAFHSGEIVPVPADVKESDGSMRPPVAAIASVATSLVDSVHLLASRGSLLAQQTQTSTKPWQDLSGRAAAKACRKLVVSAFRLFESLQVRACKDVGLGHGNKT